MISPETVNAKLTAREEKLIEFVKKAISEGQELPIIATSPILRHSEGDGFHRFFTILVDPAQEVNIE